jgi:hypothetical protein
MQVRFGERLIDARLIGAERTAALEQKSDPFEWWTLRKPVRLGLSPAASRRGLRASVYHRSVSAR